ncbi:uncharacterized protein LOC143644036 isoform X3 [Tamandua tetradactyla]|uniref:uncharacterized protein LOC143644036 isoform X3 n=1 Tax=Tamandua tetradactyla TaxID=48850 RepID=UPI004053AA62
MCFQGLQWHGRCWSTRIFTRPIQTDRWCTLGTAMWIKERPREICIEEDQERVRLMRESLRRHHGRPGADSERKIPVDSVGQENLRTDTRNQIQVSSMAVVEKKTSWRWNGVGDPQDPSVPSDCIITSCHLFIKSRRTVNPVIRRYASIFWNCKGL